MTRRAGGERVVSVAPRAPRTDHADRRESTAEQPPSARAVDLPAGRFTAPVVGDDDSFTLDASLAYAPVLSPDESRLFVPRHAIGGVGLAPWFGRPVVDVLLTKDDSPLAPPRTNHVSQTDFFRGALVSDGDVAAVPLFWMTQPRAAIYRRSADTLLVTSEGQNRLAELDARTLDPSLHPVAHYEFPRPAGSKHRDCVARPRASRSGLDESAAYVWCRTTSDIAVSPPCAPRLRCRALSRIQRRSATSNPAPRRSAAQSVLDRPGALLLGAQRLGVRGHEPRPWVRRLSPGWAR